MNYTLSHQAGLYIHIPYCLSRCGYCDFFSITNISSLPDFVSALIREINHTPYKHEHIDSIYIGGGTPSLLSGSQIDQIITACKTSFMVAESSEITLEANPEDLTLKKLQEIKRAGINRLSLGVQSAADEQLQCLQRRHNHQTSISAIELTKQAGFTNISLDFMYALPQQSLEEWQATLTFAVACKPQHISCYQLTIHDNTLFAKQIQDKAISLPPENMLPDFFTSTSQILNNAGFHQYEVSNFAKHPDYISKHNSKYWLHNSYFGFGPAAHSFHHNQRWWNISSVDQYIKRINQNQSAIQSQEQLSAYQLLLEHVSLRIRTKFGITQATLPAYTHKNIQRLIQDEYITLQNGFLYPTHKGLLIADHLPLQIIDSDNI